MNEHFIASIIDNVDGGRMSIDEAVQHFENAKSNHQNTPPEQDVFAEDRFEYDEPCLKDHIIGNKQILIGATHGSLAINGFFKRFPEEVAVHLQKLYYFESIEVQAGKSVHVQVSANCNSSFSSLQSCDFRVTFIDSSSKDPRLTASGNLKRSTYDFPTIDIEDLKSKMEPSGELEAIYALNPDARWGDHYKTVSQLHIGSDQTLTRARIKPLEQSGKHEYRMDPLVTNSALLGLFPLLGKLDINGSFLPFGIKDIHFLASRELSEAWIHVKLAKQTAEIILFDADVADDQGQVIAHFGGYSLKRVRAQRPAQTVLRQRKDRTTTAMFEKATAADQDTDEPDFYFDAAEDHPSELAADGIQDFLIRHLATVIEDASLLEDVEANLMDLGLASSQLVAITESLEKALDTELNPTLFFEYPNIKELTLYFMEEHRDTFRKMLNISDKPNHQKKATVAGPKERHQRVKKTQGIPASSTTDAVAIIGMQGMVSGAENLDQFWNNLISGRDVITEIPVDHWDYRPWFDENPEAYDKTYCKWGSFIKDVDKFDAGFFKISPREADWMDPQLRLLLQSIYATGENAGLIKNLRGTDTGVFVGVCFHDYLEMMSEKNLPSDPYIGTGNGQTVIANRISFYFDLKGPSVAVNTACSSSLFALHQACQALRLNECSMAFVSGVNLLFASSHYRYFSSIKALSPTGRCHTFDEAADGYVPGEAVCTVLLKPLHKAIQDGDRIEAVIKGSAGLHGGYTPSLTAPSVLGEENVLLKAWEGAGIDPADLSYIEAHGTGTKLGDPIEINALNKAMRKFTKKKQFCTLGSAKAHIGHVEGASGLIGIIKVVLQMNNRKLPVMPRFNKLNSLIKLESSAFTINREPQDWNPSPGKPLLAGVSSFGFSGAYAHVVIQQFDPSPPGSTASVMEAERPALVVLSAKNKKQLHEVVRQLEKAIDHQSLADITYTLQVGREEMDERLALLVSSNRELKSKLLQYIRMEDKIPELVSGNAKQDRQAVTLIESDSDLKSAVHIWIKKKKYAKLLNLWVKGYRLDWRQLYADQESDGGLPKRIPLPTYPFEKKRYWVPTPLTESTEAIPDPAPKRKASQKTKPLQSYNLYLTPVWQETQPAMDRNRFQNDRLLILGGTEQIKSSIRRHAPGALCLDLTESDTVETIKHRIKTGDTFNHVVWIAPVEPLAEEAYSFILEAQKRGVLLLFRVIKALIELCYDQVELRWTVITHNCQDVDPRQDADPTHAAVHGLIGAMAKEYPNWQVRLVDVEKGKPFLFKDIMGLPFSSLGDPVFQRDGQWWKQILAQIDTASLDSGQGVSDESAYRNEGVYVVIGGSGGIGTAWTDYMIRKYQAKIVWIGRRKMDPALQAKLDTFAEIGTKPLYIVADAGRLEELESAVEIIKRTYPVIHGVIHSALALLDQSLEKMDETRFLKSFAVKTNISLTMAAVFSKEPLDFLLFFSSIVSFAKSRGQSNYAAGCTFSDAFAHALAKQPSYNVKIINWGYWGRIGAVASPEMEERMAKAGLASIESEDGMLALERLLKAPVTQMVYMKVNDAADTQNFKSDQTIHFSSAREKELQRRLGAGHWMEQITEPSARIDTLRHRIKSQQKEIERFAYRVLREQLPPTGIIPRYAKWMEESLRILENHPHEAPLSPIELDVLWQEWERKKETWLNHSNIRAQVKLLDVALHALPDILTGKRQATDILFPQSSMDLVEGVYKDNQITQTFNVLLKNSLIAYLQEIIAHNPNRRVKILEVGAGTGSTSEVLFEHLEPYQQKIEEYCYSDISTAFLTMAEDRYGTRCPYLTYRLLDIERPVAPQSVPLADYDIVIAGNVLHATKNICTTLKNIKALLKKQGLLLLNELSKNSLFFHLTFGLLEGWWRFEDSIHRIPGCPCLLPQTWRKLLENEGFHHVHFPGEALHDLGQQIILSQSNGLIQQGNAEHHLSPSSVVTAKAAPDKREASESLSAEEVVADAETRTDYVRNEICRHLSRSLRIDVAEIDEREPFAEFGLDSITAVQLVQAINRQFGLTLSTTVLFDYSTVERLTDHLCSEYSFLGKTPPSAVSTESATNVQAREISAPAPTSDPDQTVISGNAENSGVSLKKERTATPGTRGVDAPPFLTPETTDTPCRDSRITEIAVVGMSGRFAGSENVDGLWNHLVNGDDLVTPITRWSRREYDPDAYENGVLKSGAGADSDKSCHFGSFLKAIDRFDPNFFNISGVEACYMDPQQRFFLEESWKALEDAGYAGSKKMERNCGVYVGYNGGDYYKQFGRKSPPQAMWGNAASVIAARISYYLDLQGPAISIDTACSSSLVAIHNACQALRSREIDMALAGGVFIQTTPWFYITANRAGMLSPTGRCRTFDRSADGFVPGEGVGVVALKRLHDALRDRDQILGVIRGSGLNQDGTTNGITAPSARSQERLERQVYDRYGIHPEDIQLVEAHGTATKLGDPIEFDALTRAFRTYTDKKGYCAIGSIKTNIGHVAAAAGIAGVLKVLLALRHKQIPPSIHYQTANEAIQFDASPFFVNIATRDWDVPSGTRRNAVVSAFGFSGTNAHVVIGEPQPRAAHPIQKPGYLIALSAPEERQLVRVAELFLKWMVARREASLADISYTLMTGRAHFEYRLALVVQDRQELRDKLGQWLEKGSGEYVPKENPSLGSQGSRCLTQLQAQEDPERYLELLNQGAKLYLKGCPLDMALLFDSPDYQTISLPVYPFAEERYWVPRRVHPLVHELEPQSDGFRFHSNFTGDEFFFRDHAIAGKKTLPAVAYLEMIRAAFILAHTKTGKTGNPLVRFHSIVWLEPLRIDGEAKPVDLRFRPGDASSYHFEVESKGRKNGRPVIHCKGTIEPLSDGQPPELDLKRIESQCSDGVLSANELYSFFQSLHFEYGPAFQGVQRIWFNDRESVLAEIKISEDSAEESPAYHLHPGILDSAVQACVGLAGRDLNSTMTSRVPFSAEVITIFHPCPNQVSAWIRRRDEVVDIDVADPSGRVCVQIQGLSLRETANNRRPVALTQDKETQEVLLYRPVWEERYLPMADRIDDPGTALLVFCGFAKIPVHRIEKEFPKLRWMMMEDPLADDLSETMGRKYQTVVTTLLDHLQTLIEPLSTNARANARIQVVIHNNTEGQLMGAVSGLLHSAMLEHPRINAQVILSDADTIDIEMIRQWCSWKISSDSRLLEYCSKKRQLVKSWKEIPNPVPPQVPWKDHGVYLITGGMGGLGKLLALEISATVNQAVIVLAGRSKEAESQELPPLAKNCQRATVLFRQSDVTKKEETQALIKEIVEQFGRLDGIIHCAGVVRDEPLRQKSAQTVRSVLGPKTLGVMNLDRATRHLDLSFFFLFAAGAGVFGNHGQADYAAANAFLDAFARVRNQRRAGGRCAGHTLALDWPLWEHGGMQMDQRLVAQMLQQTGLRPLKTQAAMKALYQAWHLKQDQVLVLAGDSGSIRANLMKQRTTSDYRTQTADDRPGADRFMAIQEMEEHLAAFLKTALVEVVNIPRSRIHRDTRFEKFGMDSIMQVSLLQKLETATGQLPRTLLFEHNTLRQVMAWLIRERRGMLNSYFSGIAGNNHAGQLNPPSIEPGGLPPENVEQPAGLTATHAVVNHAIAIIGISGRYPLSDTLDELWENLRSGTNCIREVGAAHWPSSASATDKNKTYSGGYLDELDRFDHHLFNVPEDRVKQLSPELRLLLELVWEALEDAEYNRNRLKSVQEQFHSGIGVFIGSMYNQYGWMYSPRQEGRMASNASEWQLANRISHFFDLTGPSLTVNSACSGSLSAIHLACESLQQGTCSMAIAGGVNLTLDPTKYEVLKQIKYLGSGTRSRSFGKGDGYLPGEGVGVVCLKPLASAISAKDKILGVIKSSMINHGGGRQLFGVPDPKSQADLIVRSIQRAAISAETIQYVESAANGSELGDPIEVQALKNAFTSFTRSKQFCALGSVKSNLGHLEAASGMSQLTKVLLQLRHRTFVPTLHARPLNPNIELEDSAFFLQEKQSPWPENKDPETGEVIPRRCMINSFGAGGSYGNLIIEEYQTASPINENIAQTDQDRYVVFLFSARTETSLAHYFKKFRTYLSTQKQVPLLDLACSLEKRNFNLDHRVAVFASSREGLHSAVHHLVHSRGTCRTLGILDSLDRCGSDPLPEEMKMAKAWLCDPDVEWQNLYSHRSRPTLSLPTYAFDHRTAFPLGKEPVAKPAIPQDESELTKDDYKTFVDQIISNSLSEDQFITQYVDAISKRHHG